MGKVYTRFHTKTAQNIPFGAAHTAYISERYPGSEDENSDVVLHEICYSNDEDE